ncbi:hypothetical protein Rfer_4420 (plasmid) [Rhodoferax ferrireducens T118]|uniref:Uncharacterized protein n=1 Tax=Albidiferax ferrireducens (strain ATCC BAA-621 / DSM 15236 / T118) TaxID=338969 RepID=Q21Q39_ALBFT|nr:hypothetical protein [Rhodoferax ferrireducens]ABD72106.1 hypothetical protein Rfer_4420 [Rhodoferax ferrireducens T118]
MTLNKINVTDKHRHALTRVIDAVGEGRFRRSDLSTCIYLMAAVSTNIYGFCVRDTHNDGLGNMSGNRSAEWALDWARRWHAEAPQSREFIVGHIGQDRIPEFNSAKAMALAAAN